MTEHAKLSASGAKKWLNCPLSAPMEEKIPQEESEYAKEGTLAHFVAENKIKVVLKYLTRVQYHKILKGYTIQKDIDIYTEDYKDFVLESFNRAKGKDKNAYIDIEHRLDLSAYVPEGFGTADCIIIADGCLEIIDLKYGKGVRVEAEDNSQLKLYALGALDEYDFIYDIKEITMTIYQPRMDNISSCSMLATDLLQWGDEVKVKAEKAYKGEGKCKAGKHCDEGFCRARPICKAYNEKSKKLERFNYKEPNQLTVDEIAEILECSDKLAKWVKVVKDYALSQAIKGVEFPGFKLVEGRSSQKFKTGQEEILEKLKGVDIDEIAPRKIKCISELKSILGKDKFDELLGAYIIKPQGSPTLVPIEDKRPKISSIETAKEDFSELIEGE